MEASSSMSVEDDELTNFTPREYQIELYEKCIKRNTIVFMETGTGKTFIAVMLIKHFMEQLKDSIPKNSNYNFQRNDDILNIIGKRTIFLVPVVPLVEQQASVIEKHTGLRVGRYSGMKFDRWTKEMWLCDMVKYDAFVMIHEIFRKVMQQGFIPWNKINLLILDEVHHATKNHPYREIMSYLYPAIEQIPIEDRPRILGMSASLVTIDASPENLEIFIKDLERTTRCTCETSHYLISLNEFAAKPKEVIVKYPQFLIEKSKCSEVINALSICQDLIEQLKSPPNSSNETIKDISIQMKNLRRCLKDTIYVFETMGFWCGKQICDLYIEEIKDDMKIIDKKSLHWYCVSAVMSALLTLTTTVNEFLNTFESKVRPKISSPKLINLIGLFNNYNDGESSQNLCGIIFCERRSVARVLSQWLQEMAQTENDKYGFLTVNFVVGHGGDSANDITNMTIKRQEETIKKFRFDEYNILVATSVLEEGLDIRQCNLVIRYDFPKTFREYVQSKGRARAENSKYVILMEDSPEIYTNIFRHLERFKRTEEILNNMCHDRTEPTEEESKKSFDDDKYMDPYMPDKRDGAARITLNCAISLVNRYCVKLPYNRININIAPQYDFTKIGDGFQCILKLPFSSRVKHEIVSPVMPNKRIAKKAAALLACEALHKAGELDDHFIPFSESRH